MFRNWSPAVRWRLDCLRVQADPLGAQSELGTEGGSVTHNKTHWGCVPGLSRQPRSLWLGCFVS